MRTRKRSLAVAVALASLGLLFAGGAAFAQIPAHQNPTGQNGGQPAYPQGNPGAMTQPTPADTTKTMSDADFAKDAAAGGLAEVKMGQLAQEKGSSDTVKNFGKQMVDDHTQANDQLKQVATQEKMKLPADLNKHDQRVYDKLSQLSGEEFDRAYARDMVRDHQNDIAEFQQEASNGQDNAIKDFASQTLPTLQHHLKMAQEMWQTVKPASGSKSGSGGNQ